MIGRTNTGGGGVGGVLTVTAPAGVAVEVSKDGKTKRKTASADGLAVFKGLASGTWTITITDGVQTATKSVEVTTAYNAFISFNMIPEFTYDGDFEIVNDSDELITVSKDNWKIRFLTSGTLIFTELKGAENGIDVFCVGGGGAGDGRNGAPNGGGGAGYTTTAKGVTVDTGTEYSIVIGAGAVEAIGAFGGDGSKTSAFTIEANGGKGGAGGAGGAGGSGGGKYSGDSNAGDGGSDGSNGFSENNAANGGGKGQGTTTREFGEEIGKLYAGGGGGGANSKLPGAGGAGGGGAGGAGRTKGTSATENTGGGGGGGGGISSGGGAGGSGIVVIRNAR